MEKEPTKEPVGEHYVANKEFSEAIVAYHKSLSDARSSGLPDPQIPEYIGTCFMKIATGLSHRPNFNGYSYRDQMVGDAILNCVRAIEKFDPNRATRTGKINAFAYFTQICWYAFLRRINLEKEQHEIRLALIEQSGANEFMTESDDAGGSVQGYDNTLINTLRNRTEKALGEERMKGKKKPKKNTPPKELEAFMQ